MRRRQPSDERVVLLRSPRLSRFDWLAHGFSARQPGAFNLSYSVGEAPATVSRNRAALLRALPSPKKSPRWRLLTLRQRHTDFLQVVRRADASRARGSFGRGRVLRERDASLKLMGDALITNQPGWLLAVQVADCLPLLIVDPARRVIAAVHAGWRGTAGRIAEKTVGRMQAEFGCDPRRMQAAVGPGIHRCCYEVGPEVAEAFAGQFVYVEKVIRRVHPSPSAVHWQQHLFPPVPAAGERRPRPALTPPAAEKFHLDLVEANCRQLRAAGLKAANIWVSPFCTACRTDLFFSHRAEQGRTGRMMGVVGIRG